MVGPGPGDLFDLLSASVTDLTPRLQRTTARCSASGRGAEARCWACPPATSRWHEVGMAGYPGRRLPAGTRTSATGGQARPAGNDSGATLLCRSWSGYQPCV